MSTTTVVINTVQPVGQMLYVDQTYGSDSGPTIGLRNRFDRPFLTPEAAKAAAIAGDLIHVGPGDYVVTANLAKNGVNWYFEQGSVVTLSPVSQSVDMFGDGGSAVTFSIGGFGDLITDLVGDNSSICNVISVTHLDSVVDVHARDIINNGTVSAGSFSDPIHQDGGSLTVECRDIICRGLSAGYPVWWSDGRMSIRAREIRQLSTGSGGVSVSATSVNYPTGECFIKCDLIESATAGSYAIHQEVPVGETPTADSTAKVWIESLSIVGVRPTTGPSTNHAVYKSSGGNLYITTQKVNGSIYTEGAYGTFYINAQKQQGFATDDPVDGMIELGGALSYIDILEVVDGANQGGHIYVKAGAHNVNVGSLIRQNAGDCVLMEGGTLNLSGVFDTSVSNTSNPINKTGGTLTLNDCTLIPEATRNAVEAATAQTVYSNGSTSAFDSHANVTFEGDFFYNDGTDATGNVATQNANGSWSWAAPAGGGGTWGSITGTLSAQTDLQAALDAKANKALTIRTYVGTTDALVIGDAGNMVRGNNAAGNVITVPLNATVAFPIGSQVLVSQYGAGQTSFTPEGGVTINSGGAALKIAIRYGCAVLTKTDTNEWNLEGNLAI